VDQYDVVVGVQYAVVLGEGVHQTVEVVEGVQ
jgi:hypothetical protein